MPAPSRKREKEKEIAPTGTEEKIREGYKWHTCTVPVDRRRKEVESQR
jgi:hypothetical protein